MKLLLLTLALVAVLELAPRAQAAEQVMTCQDANQSDWPVSPAHPCPTGQGLLTPVAGSQEALGVATATALTVPTFGTNAAPATIAVITVEGVSVRWRCDGTAPTASSGSLLAAGTQTFTLVVTPLSACQFIQTSATATLDVEYFHQ